jgi:hypothetical protein
MFIAEMIVAPKGVAYWAVTLLLGLAAAAVYLANAPNRTAIDEALGDAAGRDRPFLRMTALCGADIAHLLQTHALRPPERLWCYDKSYLESFRKTASAHQTKFGDTILARYLRPTLIWNDIAFAVLLSLFTALAAFGLASHAPWPWTSYLMLAFGCLAIVYGIVDVLEDWVLARLLDGSSEIDAAAATAANTLTRIKLASLSLSVIGALAFLLFGLIWALMKRIP